MCGIFGLCIHESAEFAPPFIKKSLTTLARLSESRGKDSSGLVFRNELENEFLVVKGPIPLKYLLGKRAVAQQMDRMVQLFHDHRGTSRQNVFAAMGHSRLVTNGTHSNELNNQPIVKDGIVGIHNGIVVNDNELWARYPDAHRTCETDTEVMLALTKKYLDSGWDLPSAVSMTGNEIFGTFAAAFFVDTLDQLVLATNNGSLYILTNDADMLAFASERYFLEKTAEAMNLDAKADFRIRQVVSGTGVVLDLRRFHLQEFTFSDIPKKSEALVDMPRPYRVVTQSLSDGRPQRELILDPAKIAAHPTARTEAGLLEFNIEEIQTLRRCVKCILPETFPFIEYDRSGICNYCKNYRVRNEPKPIEELLALVEPYRRTDGGYDCIVPYSGGRDSTHTLHIIKNVLKLNPVAFTYDWGMVNDLARRNIARVCGKLGVENILVSADIALKRKNIRKNILAWLKNPSLGMIPLFMAGDKYFFHYTDQVKKQTGIRLNIWGVNPLENTDFKVGFLGVPPDFNKRRIYSLSVKRQGKLLSSIGWNILRNPRYINSSVWDTLGSFVSRSIVPHRDYYHLYDYYRWDENEIERLVREEYKWETAIDTKTTWRIGDGTAPFYNYIYYTVAGFSEHDTFRSNQIREGMLSREEGLRLVMEENRPRYASIKWYTGILQLDFTSTMRGINAIPKLYR
ncbi:MAG: glucosamine 6-phosphate synthetase [Elusimicrobia bacterium]|nr:glucosamine 6-phosphate synthetase [Elusimicrobiota bacterium]